MIVKTCIRRNVTIGKEKDFFSQLKILRITAMDQQGYISGETLISAENTQKVMVISKWETLEDWNNWKDNEKRIEINARLNEFQDTPAICEPYVFSKHKAAANLDFPPPLQEQYS